MACQKGHTEVVEMLLEHPRIVPNQANESDKVCGLCCLVLPLIQGLVRQLRYIGHVREYNRLDV